MALLIYGINSKITEKEKILKIVSDYELHFEKFESVFTNIRKNHPQVEAVILSTCLRYEILITTPESSYASRTNNIEKKIAGAICDFLKKIIKKYGLAREQKEFFHAAGECALTHLYSVMCGFESEDIGEIQVLGQIKDSYLRCRQKGFCGDYISAIYNLGLKCAAKIRNKVPIFAERNILKNNILKKLHERFGDEKLANKNALIMGSGKNAENIRRALSMLKIKTRLVKEKNVNIDDDVCAHYDIWIFCINDINYSMTLSEPSFNRTHGKNIIIIDLAISRSVPPEVAALENVELLTLEDLIPAAWQRNDPSKKRKENKEFYETARKIVIEAAQNAGKEILLRFGNGEKLFSLMKESAKKINDEFDITGLKINENNYQKKLLELKRVLIKKIPALIKRRLID